MTIAPKVNKSWMSMMSALALFETALKALEAKDREARDRFAREEEVHLNNAYFVLKAVGGYITEDFEETNLHLLSAIKFAYPGLALEKALAEIEEVLTGYGGPLCNLPGHERTEIAKRFFQEANRLLRKASRCG